MSQFRIKGIDYIDESLQHGLGKGSGRGRPLGSKNGQVMPGAAYMKGYEIVGQKAAGETTLPGAKKTRNQTIRSTAPRQMKNNGRPAANGTGNASASRQTGTSTKPAGTTKTGARQMSSPAATVANGKNAVSKMLGGSTQTVNSNTTAQTPSATNAQEQQGGFRWSAQRVNAAGGLEAREGRQVVYDNPTLSEDYKKQIAKRFGDSDGRSYPKAIEKTEAQKETQTPESVGIPRIDPSKLRAAGPGASDVRYGGRSSLPEQTISERTIPEQTISERTIPEQTISEQTIPEQTITEQAPAETQQAKQETPEQKSIWDSVGGWLGQVGKSIGDTVVGAWNTASGAINDAANWVGERMNEAGEWAKTAYNDVSAWVGNRAQEFGSWIGTAANDVGKWVGNAANDVGKWVGNAANDVGQWVGNAANDAGKWIGNAANDVGRAVSGATDTVFGSYQVVGRDEKGNPIYGNQRQGGALNAAGQWVGNAANDVRNAAVNATDSVFGSYPVVGTDDKGNPIFGNQRQGGFVNSAGQWVDRAANDVADSVLGSYPVIGGYTDGRPIYGNQRRGGFINDAGQWVNNNVVTPVTNAANDAGQWVNNAVDDVFGRYPQYATKDGGTVYGDRRRGGFINDTVSQIGDQLSEFWDGPLTYNPKFRSQMITEPDGSQMLVNYGGYERQGGFRDKAGQWLNNNIVTPVTNAADAAGQWVGNAANEVGRFATNTADNVFGRYPVVDTDENGNLVYGNQRQGGLLNNAAVDARRWATREAGPWLNENVVTPATNAANDAGQWIGNAANDAGQWIGDTANNVGRAASDWWNGTDQSFMGIKTGHTPGARENIARAANDAGQWIGNAANDAGQWVSNTANDVGQWVDTNLNPGSQRYVANQAAQRAVSAGVPQSAIDRVMMPYLDGSTSEEQYMNSINRLIEDYGK